MTDALFFAFSGLAVVSALLAVTRKNAVAAACWLVVMFFGLAGVFVLEEAFFVATTQILVYAGAIMVLFLFVIMLLDLRSVELSARQGPRLRFMGVLLAGAFLAAVLYAVEDAKASPRIADRVGAVLLRPPAPAPASDDPFATAEAPKAPPPRRLEVVAAGAGAPGATAPFAPGERAYAATVPAEGASPARTLLVSLRPDGDVAVSVDGARATPPAWAATGRTMTGSVAVPGEPVGTTVEVTVVRGGLDASPGGGPDGSARAIGRSLFEDFLLPFEVASILLTGAIFGAVVLTKRRLS
jgi:NADH:ubiquinone oxidoreductase subunit 6 (subunit J)